MYEDALTVLSYASPYPVKVSLQKEKSYHGNSSDEKAINLSHPLYRSQSLDALVRIGKEKFLKPKRSYSEIKPDGKKQPSKVALNEPNPHEALTESFENGESVHTQLSVNDKISDNDQSIIIHRVEDTVHAEMKASLNSAPNDDGQRPIAGSMDTVDLSTSEVEESQFAAIFDKFSAPNTINFDDSNVDLSKLESDLKPPEEQMNEVEDVVQITTASSTLEHTPTIEYHSQDIIKEDAIVPKSQERQISIGSENIEFTLVAPDEPGNDSPIKIEEFHEDTLRSESPSSDSSSGTEAVDEDLISPTIVKREAQEPKTTKRDNTPDLKENEHKSSSDNDKINEYLSFNDNEDQNITTSVKDTEKDDSNRIAKMHNNNDLFKTRDDLSTGMPFLDTESGTVARAVSYDTELPDLVEQKEHLVPTRADSLKEDKKSSKQSKESSLEWSGKRLIRSGSFSEIPQDGTTDGDWASSPENRTITSNDDYYTESDSDSTRDAPNMARTDKFQQREDLANFSDLTDSNSSRGSSPDLKTNGQDDGIGTSPEMSPSKSPKENSIDFDVKHNNELNSNKLTDSVNKPPTISTKYEGFGAYTVVVGQDEDTSDA